MSKYNKMNIIQNNKDFLKRELDEADSIDLKHLFDSYEKLKETFNPPPSFTCNTENPFHIPEEKYTVFFSTLTPTVAWLSAISTYLYALNNYKKIVLLISCDYFSKNFSHKTYFPFIPEINPGMSFFDLSCSINNKLEQIRYELQSIAPQEYNYSYKNNENESYVIIHISNKKHTPTKSLCTVFSNNKTPYLELLTPLIIPDLLKKYINIHIKNILLIGLKNPNIKIKNIPLLTRYEHKKIVWDWNKTKKNFPLLENLSISELIEQHVQSVPQAIALNFEDQTISYRELGLRINEFSSMLIKNRIKKNEGVLILLDRSINMLVAIIAVLKCGGYYVPVDTRFPEERVHFILEDSKATFIITTKNFISKLNLTGLCCQEIDFFGESMQLIKTENHLNLPLEDVAYLIYTSGSTGDPKGTLISSRNVINYCCWFMDWFKFNRSSVIDFSSSISFDLSVSCTLMPLIAGGRVIIINDETKLDILGYLNLLIKEKITHAEWTPDYFYHLLQFPEEIKKLKYLNWIMLGGDAIVKKDVETCFTLLPEVNIVNEYGPTECTVAITACIINGKSIGNYNKSIPIGKPAINTQTYVLNKYMNPCPIGIPGELYISGKSVSLGYLNRKISEEKFIINPFNKVYNKMYKTGDIARWLPDGNLEFLGREDDQVKIRGFRIELKEVEMKLLQHQEVKQCKIILRSLYNIKILIAYLVLEKLSRLTSKKLREFLAKSLPDYMIPGQFIIVNHFPTSTTGKIDVNALEKISIESNFEVKKKPSKQIDIIKSIWCDGFGISTINPQDNFFDLGGNSLIALNIMAQIHTRLGIKLHIKTLFLNPTIEKLSHSATLLKKNINREIEDYKIPQVICLGAKKNSHSIFLIHPVGGGIFAFQPLAQHLNDSYSIYGLQDPGIEDPSVRFNSLQEMAFYYVQAIQTCQPRGPYQLAGASFGASLAVEIARQFISIGKEVSFIGLFDGWAQYPLSFKNKEFFKNFMSARIKGFAPEYTAQLLEMQYSRERLLHEHAIAPIQNKLTLFKSEEIWPVFQNIDTQDNGWGKYGTQFIEVHRVPGDHESMFLQENVTVLARKLKKCLIAT